jgi:hypothetical protein
MINDLDVINITQNMPLSRLVAQLQKHSNQLLCVINDTNLIYFNHKKHLPKNISFIEYKIFDKNDIEYYFKDDENRYTIFGTNEACVFYPSLPQLLNLEKKEEKIKIIEYVGKEKKIILYHLGNKLKFPFSNKNLNIIDKSIV